MKERALRAITFDFWQTLLHEPPGHSAALRRDRWMARLGAAGIVLDEAAFDAAMRRSWDRYVERWVSNVQYLAPQAAADVLDDLGHTDIDADLRDALLADFANAGIDAELEPTPGIESCLRALKDAGLRIGIVCDVGMTSSPILRQQLERHGLLGYFDHWSFSDEVGWYKPAPEIFEHALAGLGGVAPEAAAHIGDIRRTDVAGAQAVGMLAVRYSGVSDDQTDGPEGDIVCADHAQLPKQLL